MPPEPGDFDFRDPSAQAAPLDSPTEDINPAAGGTLRSTPAISSAVGTAGRKRRPSRPRPYFFQYFLTSVPHKCSPIRWEGPSYIHFHASECSLQIRGTRVILSPPDLTCLPSVPYMHASHSTVVLPFAAASYVDFTPIIFTIKRRSTR